MVLSQRLLGFVAFATLAGCGGTDEGVGDWAQTPAPQTQGGPGGAGGANGLNPSDYHANVSALLAAMGVAAADPNDEAAVNPALISTGLLNSEGGRDVFEYAARCALPAEASLANGSETYLGGGILATTGSWMTGGLTTAQKEDVLTCMVAHLNAVGAHVAIFLSGPSITTFENADDNGFSVEEAIWQAKIPGAGQAPEYHAWPRANLLNVCGLLSVTNWIKRICGTTINTCGVQIHYNQSTACTGSNGNYTCNGSPTIQTTLQNGELCDLYIAGQ